MSMRAATISDHDNILALAKMSAHTKDFGHMMFSGESAYEKGWIRVFDTMSGGILGFTCVRHKVRQPETSLYFIAVHNKCTRTGIGETLLLDLKQQCPHKRIALNVMQGNAQALQFYKKHGFSTEGESLKGKGFRLILEWD